MTQITPTMIAVFCLGTSLIFTLVILGLPGKETPSLISKRLAAIERVSSSEPRENDVLSLAEDAGQVSGFNLETWIQSRAAGRQLDTLILQSGTQITMLQFVFASIGFALTAGIIVAVCVSGWPLAVSALLLAGALPYAILRKRHSSRLVQFEAALPEALALMARCLRAGHSIASALEVIADQSKEPLSSEFARVFQQQRLGVIFRDSMLELAVRIPSQDLHFLVTAILVQRESGGDLTEILDGTTRVISDRMRIAAQVRVHTAQGRLSGWVLSALPFVLFIIINLLNPGYSRLLFTDPTGRLLLYGGLGSIGAGILMIRKIVNVKA